MQWLLGQQATPSWSSSTCAAAAHGGHLPMLQFLRSCVPQCPWDAESCRNACKASNLRVLAWLRGQQPPCPWTSACYIECLKAACLRDPWHPRRMIKWMRKQKPACPWTPDCCVQACKSGSGLVSLLQWLAADPPFTWTRQHCVAAAKMPAKPIMKLLLGLQTPLDEPARASRLQKIQKMLVRANEQYGRSWEGNLEYMNPAVLAMPDLWDAAGERGQWPVLKWLLQHPHLGLRCAQVAFDTALRNDQPDAVEYILSRSRPEEITFPEQRALDPEQCSSRCLLVLAKAGCPMRQSHPFRVGELVRAWHVFVNEVTRAKAAKSNVKDSGLHAHQQMSQPSPRNATSDELLDLLAQLPPELVCKVADMAFLSPNDAKNVK